MKGRRGPRSRRARTTDRSGRALAFARTRHTDTDYERAAASSSSSWPRSRRSSSAAPSGLPELAAQVQGPHRYGHRLQGRRRRSWRLPSGPSRELQELRPGPLQVGGPGDARYTPAQDRRGAADVPEAVRPGRVPQSAARPAAHRGRHDEAGTLVRPGLGRVSTLRPVGPACAGSDGRLACRGGPDRVEIDAAMPPTMARMSPAT